MKLVMRLILVGIILSFAISSQAPQPALAQKSVTLTPGKYSGKFNLNLCSYTATQVSTGSLNNSNDQNYNLYVVGVVNITVSKPDQGIANVEPDTASLYEIHTIHLSGAVKCSALGVMDADATIFSLGALTNNFDPTGALFSSPFTISDITNHISAVHPSGSAQQCNYPVSAEVLKKWLDDISNAINRIGRMDFGVLYSREARIGGDVSVPGWEKTTPVQFGQVEHTVDGVWDAYRVSSKPKGWKK